MKEDKSTGDFILPDLLLLVDFNGNPKKFIYAAYNIYKENFLENRVIFRGQSIRIKRIPYVEGFDCTFYHITHEGKVESDRIPDIRRLERIRWPKYLIENCENSKIKVWENIRRGSGTKYRILVFLEDENYLIILDKRKDKILFWTAYLVNNHQRIKLLKEYAEYIKTEAAK